VNLITWLVKKLGGTTPVTGDLRAYADEYALLVGDVFIRELAFISAAHLVAKTVSKCEFKTFIRNKEIKGPEYYLWNVEPNKNQNSSEFIQKWLYTLLRKNECLIIEQNNQLLIADSYNKTPYALYEDTFTDVTVKDFTFGKTFKQSEVLYFKLSDANIQKVLVGLFESYSQLIAYSMKSYKKSRGTKGIFEYDTIPVAGTEERKAFDAIINEKMNTWLNGDNAALPLGRGQKWHELEHKTYSSESTRDIKAQIDDVFDFTAKGFGIPPAILRGDVQGTSDAVDQLLTFCIDPLIDMLAEEINRKRNGYSAFISGTYLKIDSKQIKHVDLLSVSTSIDKLIGSGTFCINDIRKVCGEEIIDEPWAWAHFMTKNYVSLDEAVKALTEGGEKR
jgi:HK97 family phage portal protein